MRIDPTNHLKRAYLVHRLAADFALLDVWRLPAEARSEEDSFERFVQSFPLLQPNSLGNMQGATKLLLALRAGLLRLFGVHDDAPCVLTIPGCSEHSVRERMSEQERAQCQLAARDSHSSSAFMPVYGTGDERLYELSNPTVHALLHLSWVPEGSTRRAYMAVYAKPRGLLGRAYMALISPFRHLIVYPALMKMIERAWQRRPALAHDQRQRIGNDSC
jgi:hypothetical protein